MALITSSEVINLAFSSVEQITPGIVKETKIEAAQERYIRPAFGEEMYDAMTAGRYPEFVNDYLKPTLAYFVRHDLIPEVSTPVGNTGAMVPSANHANAATDKQRELAMDSAMNSANALLGKAIRHIEAHRDGFPEYKPTIKCPSIRGGIVF